MGISEQDSISSVVFLAGRRSEFHRRFQRRGVGEELLDAKPQSFGQGLWVQKCDRLKLPPVVQVLQRELLHQALLVPNKPEPLHAESLWLLMPTLRDKRVWQKAMIFIHFGEVRCLVVLINPPLGAMHLEMLSQVSDCGIMKLLSWD